MKSSVCYLRDFHLKITCLLSVLSFWLVTSYSQDAIFSNPQQISIDPDMLSTMAAGTLDKNGKLHIVYVGWYYKEGAPDNVASEIFYTNNVSGNFAVPVKLPAAVLPFQPSFEDDFYYSKEPSVTVDSEGVVHVAYYRTEGQLNGASWICYTSNKGGSFSVPSILYYNPLDDYSKYCSYGNSITLATGPANDSVHIVFTGNSGTGHGGVRYSAGLNGTFRKPVTYCTASERGTLRFDKHGALNIVYFMHSDTSDIFSKVNLVRSRIINKKFTEPDLMFASSGTFAEESSFSTDQYDSIHVVFRNTSSGFGHYQMQYVEGNDNHYSGARELPSNTIVSLMYSIETGNNQTEYIAYKQAAGYQSLGFMYNDGSGFRDITPDDYKKYGFISAGPQRFVMDKTNRKAYFVYTDEQIQLVTIDLGDPSVPVCSVPAADAKDVAAPTIFKWFKSPKAGLYDLQVSASADFGTLLTNMKNLGDTAFTDNNLLSKTSYYWRIRARGAGGTSDWSLPMKFTTASPVNVERPRISHDITLYPNPVQDVLFIEGTEGEETLLNIFSIDGTLLMQKNDRGIRSVNLEKLRNGTYFIKITSSSVNFTQKIIKH